MRQFCEEVLKFLESEYDDSYQFEMRVWTALPAVLTQGNNQKAEITIKISPCYKLIISEDSMQYLFCCYLTSEYIAERNQYRWQKELIDMIEGG